MAWSSPVFSSFHHTHRTLVVTSTYLVDDNHMG